MTETQCVIDELRLLDEEPERFAIFAWKNLAIVVWMAPPDASAFARLGRVGRGRIKEHASGLSDIHLITGRVGLPDAAARAALVEESRKAVGHVAAVAVLLEGSGFWASAIRSFVTSVHVLVQGPFELRLFGSAGEVVDWLPSVHETRTGVNVAPEHLREVLQLVQARTRDSRRRAS